MKRQKSNPVTKTIRMTYEDHQKWVSKKKDLRKKHPLLRCTDEIIASKLIKDHLGGLDL